MQAIILAAGLGRRLGELTSSNTKCMVEVNGVTLIYRMLTQLSRLHLSRIIVVIGYEGAQLKNYIESHFSNLPIMYVENPIYDKTNNIYSLWLTKEYLSEDDTLLLESDLIFEDSVLDTVLECPYTNCALISKYETWMDGTMVKIDQDFNIVNFIPKKAFDYSDTESYYKTVNIYKFSRNFLINHYLPFLEAYIKVLGENEYYEQVLRVLTLIDKSDIKALPITGKLWYEIDDIQDLRIAETIFAEPKECLKKLQKSFGGYWRYPRLKDYCYLVNPYFPSQRLVDEMKANFDNLLRDYPSGMGINALLGSKMFGIREEFTVVGNGAAELIKSLMEFIPGNVGVIYPTFEEYPNRLSSSDIIAFHPNNENFSYNAKDLMDFYSDKDIKALLIVNPDNPSGNLLSSESITTLLRWSESKGIKLILDESFIDFADNGQADTLLSNKILMQHKNLFVMKSISKSFGVPGLRLGILASSDTESISAIKKDVSIWNINSFAEFYMQIYNKYEKDYLAACDKFREERNIFYDELKEISFLRVVPSQANYFLCEVLNGISSHDLALRLLTDFKILIKDCSSKKGFPDDKQYVRIAIRDRKDNQRLIQSLKTI